MVCEFTDISVSLLVPAIIIYLQSADSFHCLVFDLIRHIKCVCWDQMFVLEHYYQSIIYHYFMICTVQV